MKEYWHLTDEGLPILMHNVRLRQGHMLTMDLINNMLPGATTPYAALTSEKRKEEVWERVRVEAGYNDLPGRIKTLFAFLSKEDAEIARKNWNLPDRRLVRLQAQENSKVFMGDSRLLDCREKDWEAHALQYWSGVRTVNPIIEVIISGEVFFPDWRDFPSLA